MAKKSDAERLSNLREKTRSLSDRIRKKERARETRRQVLLGQFLWRAIGNPQHPMVAPLTEWLVRDFLPTLSEDFDRDLFQKLFPQSDNPAFRDNATFPPELMDGDVIDPTTIQPLFGSGPGSFGVESPSAQAADAPSSEEANPHTLSEASPPSIGNAQ